MLPLLSAAVFSFAGSLHVHSRSLLPLPGCRVRSTSPSMTSPAFWVHAFEDPLPSLVGAEDLEAALAAQNVAEDMGGVVGGSYLLGGAIAIAGASAAYIALSRAPSAAQSDVAHAAVLGPAPAPWKINAHGPAPRGRTWFFGDFTWKTSRLPSLGDLEHSCYMIGEGATRSLYLCLSQVGDDCVEDSTYSEYYGQPVYLCVS